MRYHYEKPAIYLSMYGKGDSFLMDKQMLVNAVKSVRTAAKRHSPEILTGIGIAGMITTTIMAVRATPKALTIIGECEVDENRKLSKTEVVKATWTCYIPSAIVGGASIACLVGSTSVNLRRNAALAAAYSCAETALREYQDRVVEVIGEKKEQTIRDAVAKERIEKHPVSEQQILYTGHGDTLCYDAWCSRYFKSDIEVIRRAIHELNDRLRVDDYISLNEFYDAIGLEESKTGEILGWNIGKGYIQLAFSSVLASDLTPFPDTPCLAIDFRVPPQYDYDRGW